jgi:hypothetical protein
MYVLFLFLSTCSHQGHTQPSWACLSLLSSSSLLSFSAHQPRLRLVFRILPLPHSYLSLPTCLVLGLSSSSSLLSFSAHLPRLLGLSFALFLFLTLILLCSPASSLGLVFRSLPLPRSHPSLPACLVSASSQACLPLPRSYPSLLTCLVSWACLSPSSSSSLSSFSAHLPSSLPTRHLH